jgi:glutaryl-CoA dehydrogenase
MESQLPTADLLGFESLLAPHERAKLEDVRDFLAREVAPYATGWWDRAEFPHELLPGLAALDLSTPVQQGYSHLFSGFLIAEMTRTDTSIATFFMVHHDLFVEALQVFGSEDQKARLLRDARDLRITGAFALTEPLHGSDVAGGLATTAMRDGDSWVIEGAKRWIGNGTFCDHMLLWARDTGTGAVRGFILDATLPGVTRTAISNKTALRTVQNADVVLQGVRVAEADRLAGISSFDDIRQLLLGSRILVGWQAVGQQLAAFDVARRYAVERHRSGRTAGFPLVQDQLVTMTGNITACLAVMARTARLQGQGVSDMPRAAFAKSFTTVRMRETVALGHEVLGADGILGDHRMAKILADAEAIYTYEGSYEINSLIVGRALTGVPAFT